MAEILHDAEDFIERHRNLRIVDRARRLHAGGGHTQLPAVDVFRIWCATAANRRQRLLLAGGKQHRARSVAQLHQAAVRNFPHELGEFLLELGAVADFRLRAERCFEALYALSQAPIHTGDQAFLKCHPHTECESAEAKQQRGGMPGGKTLADGDAHHPSSPRRQEPTPRTVRSTRGSPDHSILPRSRRTKASSVLLSISESLPQTLSISDSRVNTRSGLRISSSRMAYSVRVSSIFRAPRRTSRVPR